MRLSFSFLALILSVAPPLFAADSQKPETTSTLAGSWSGRWTDARPEYRKSGGDFTCRAVEKESGCWTATFNVGKARTFKVELKGKADSSGRVVFNSAVDLGSFYGIYTWKGVVDKDGFTGEYDGPDEKGTFVMTRANTLQTGKVP